MRRIGKVSPFLGLRLMTEHGIARLQSIVGRGDVFVECRSTDRAGKKMLKARVLWEKAPGEAPVVLASLEDSQRTQDQLTNAAIDHAIAQHTPKFEGTSVSDTVLGKRSFGNASQHEDDDDDAPWRKRQLSQSALKKEYGLSPLGLTENAGGVEAVALSHLQRFLRRAGVQKHDLRWSLTSGVDGTHTVELLRSGAPLGVSNKGLLLAYRNSLEQSIKNSAQMVGEEFEFKFESNTRKVSPPGAETIGAWTGYLHALCRVYHGKAATNQIAIEQQQNRKESPEVTVSWTLVDGRKLTLGCSGGDSVETATLAAIKAAIRINFPAAATEIMKEETPQRFTSNEKPVSTPPQKSLSRLSAIRDAVDRLVDDRYHTTLKLRQDANELRFVVPPGHGTTQLVTMLKTVRVECKGSYLLAKLQLYWRFLGALHALQSDQNSAHLIDNCIPSRLPDGVISTKDKFVRWWFMVFGDEEILRLTCGRVADASGKQHSVVTLVAGKERIALAASATLGGALEVLYARAGISLFSTTSFVATSPSSQESELAGKLPLHSSAVTTPILHPQMKRVLHTPVEKEAKFLDQQLVAKAQQVLDAESIDVFAAPFTVGDAVEWQVVALMKPKSGKIPIEVSLAKAAHRNVFVAIHKTIDALTSEDGNVSAVFAAAISELTSRKVQHLDNWTAVHIAQAVYARVHDSELVIEANDTPSSEGFTAVASVRFLGVSCVVATAAGKNKRASTMAAAIEALRVLPVYQDLTSIKLSQQSPQALPTEQVEPTSKSATKSIPLVSLLRAALKNDRPPKALRVEKGRITGGYYVRLHAVPMVGHRVNLQAEQQIAFEKHTMPQKALNQACYRVLQEDYAEELAAAIAENPDILEDVL